MIGGRGGGSIASVRGEGKGGGERWGCYLGEAVRSPPLMDTILELSCRPHTPLSPVGAVALQLVYLGRCWDVSVAALGFLECCQRM